MHAIDFRIGIMAGANSSLNQLYTYSDIKKTDPKLINEDNFTNYWL